MNQIELDIINTQLMEDSFQHYENDFMKNKPKITVSCSETDFALRVKTRKYTNIHLVEHDVYWDIWEVNEGSERLVVTVHHDYHPTKKESQNKIVTFIKNLFK